MVQTRLFQECLSWRVEKAKEIAEKLGKPEFKGSRGWLDKWKKRYNVKQLRICGESGDVQGATVESWKERLPEIVQGYEWNMDETGVYWRALRWVWPKK